MPVKLCERKKVSLMNTVKAMIEKTSKLKEHVSRIQIRQGRVYLYHLHEPHIPEGAILTKPLIDGKYLEFPLARFTIYDNALTDCSFDWPDSSEKFMTLGEGSLEECIKQAEESEWITI